MGHELTHGFDDQGRSIHVLCSTAVMDRNNKLINTFMYMENVLELFNFQTITI